MHNKSRNLKHSKIANNLMSYIYDNIEIDIDINELSDNLDINKFHLHRIFKKETGTNIYETIRNIRLQKASNLLISNSNSTITEIANMCGYSHHTSFIRAFKKRFYQTPKYWRNGGFLEYSNTIFNNENKIYKTDIDFSKLKQGLVKVNPRMAYYKRQNGYNSDFKQIWEEMTAWIFTNNIIEYQKIAIYHDNPTITALNECNYVACVIPKDKNIILINNNLPQLEIQECLCITFEIEGTTDDILMLIKWVYEKWLPNNCYEKITIPPYLIFDEDFISNKKTLIKGTYHIPVKYI